MIVKPKENCKWDLVALVHEPVQSQEGQVRLAIGLSWAPRFEQRCGVVEPVPHALGVAQDGRDVEPVALLLDLLERL